jgi:hypothetical protein
LDAGRAHARAPAGLVFGQHAGDVVVDDDHLIDMAQPLLREDADRGGAAADAHALLALAVDDGRMAGLHDDARPPSMVVPRPRRLQSFSSVAGDAPSRLVPPVRWRTPPSDSICEPYSAVVTWPTCSPSTRTAAVSGPRCGRCRSSP